MNPPVSARSEFSAAARIALGATLSYLPFGIVCGVAAVQAGMTEAAALARHARGAPLKERVLFAAPMLLLVDGTAQILPSTPRLIAALATLWTAIRWRGYLMPLVLGMVVLHVAQWALQS